MRLLDRGRACWLRSVRIRKGRRTVESDRYSVNVENISNQFQNDGKGSLRILNDDSVGRLSAGNREADTRLSAAECCVDVSGGKHGGSHRVEAPVASSVVRSTSSNCLICESSDVSGENLALRSDELTKRRGKSRIWLWLVAVEPSGTDHVECEEVSLDHDGQRVCKWGEEGLTAKSDEAGFHSNEETSVPFGPSGTGYSVTCDEIVSRPLASDQETHLTADESYDKFQIVIPSSLDSLQIDPLRDAVHLLG